MHSKTFRRFESCMLVNKILLTFWVICQRHCKEISDYLLFLFIIYSFITISPKYLTVHPRMDLQILAPFVCLYVYLFVCLVCLIFTIQYIHSMHFLSGAAFVRVPRLTKFLTKPYHTLFSILSLYEHKE